MFQQINGWKCIVYGKEGQTCNLCMFTASWRFRTWRNGEVEAPAERQRQEATSKRHDQRSFRLLCFVNNTRWRHHETGTRDQRCATWHDETNENVAYKPHDEGTPTTNPNIHYLFTCFALTYLSCLRFIVPEHDKREVASIVNVSHPAQTSLIGWEVLGSREDGPRQSPL